MRRPPGEIVEAITRVLATAGDEGLRLRDIHAAVEKLQAELVSPSSVKNCLAVKCRGSEPTFDRLARGRYRLAADST